MFGWAYGGKLQEGRNACRNSVEELITQKTDNRRKVNMELDNREFDCMGGRYRYLNQDNAICWSWTLNFQILC